MTPLAVSNLGFFVFLFFYFRCIPSKRGKIFSVLLNRNDHQSLLMIARSYMMSLIWQIHHKVCGSYRSTTVTIVLKDQSEVINRHFGDQSNVMKLEWKKTFGSFDHGGDVTTYCYPPHSWFGLHLLTPQTRTPTDSCDPAGSTSLLQSIPILWMLYPCPKHSPSWLYISLQCHH